MENIGEMKLETGEPEKNSRNPYIAHHNYPTRIELGIPVRADEVFNRSYA